MSQTNTNTISTTTTSTKEVTPSFTELIQYEEQFHNWDYCSGCLPSHGDMCQNCRREKEEEDFLRRVVERQRREEIREMGAKGVHFDNLDCVNVLDEEDMEEIRSRRELQKLGLWRNFDIASGYFSEKRSWPSCSKEYLLHLQNLGYTTAKPDPTPAPAPAPEPDPIDWYLISEAFRTASKPAPAPTPAPAPDRIDWYLISEAFRTASKPAPAPTPALAPSPASAPTPKRVWIPVTTFRTASNPHQHGGSSPLIDK